VRLAKIRATFIAASRGYRLSSAETILLFLRTKSPPGKFFRGDDAASAHISTSLSHVALLNSAGGDPRAINHVSAACLANGNGKSLNAVAGKVSPNTGAVASSQSRAARLAFSIRRRSSRNAGR
jgi:hypothetical protein